MAVATAVVLFAGPTLYLLGSTWLHHVQSNRGLRPRVVGAAALVVGGAAVVLLRTSIPPLAAVAVPIAVLTAVALASGSGGDADAEA